MTEVKMLAVLHYFLCTDSSLHEQPLLRKKEQDGREGVAWVREVRYVGVQHAGQGSALGWPAEFPGSFQWISGCYPISYLQSIWFKPELVPLIIFLTARKATAWMQAALFQSAAWESFQVLRQHLLLEVLL